MSLFMKWKAKRELKKQQKQKTLKEENEWLKGMLAVQNSRIAILEEKLERLQEGK